MHGMLQVFLGSQSGLMLMFCIFKLNFEIDIWAILAWHLFWLLFPNFGWFFQIFRSPWFAPQPGQKRQL